MGNGYGHNLSRTLTFNSTTWYLLLCAVQNGLFISSSAALRGITSRHILHKSTIVCCFARATPTVSIDRSSPVALEVSSMPPFIHRPTDAGFDSRRYATKRRYSNFGYYDMPAVNDAMTFMLPPFQNLHSRLVKVGPKLWQLWSPNSPLNVFYPGIRAPGFEVKMENDEEKRRFNGHLGQFDPTRSPDRKSVV